MAVIPARPRKPKDKAKVEGGVLIAQRWILACLRNRTFFSLEELNVAIAELLEKLNMRPFQKLEGCRRSAFESIDRPAMKSLPTTRYEMADWTKAKVHIDYHVAFDDRFYSASYTLIGARVEIRATASTVEILHGGARVASHRRSYGRKGTFVTVEEHRPPPHRGHTAWPPERMIAWAASFGPSVARVVELMIARYLHPESSYRACLGMIRCAQKYGSTRTDAACARALIVAGPIGPKRKYIEAMLKRGLDRAPSPSPMQLISPPPTAHENVRGGRYYDKEETRDHGRNDPQAHVDEDAHDGEGAACVSYSKRRRATSSRSRRRSECSSTANGPSVTTVASREDSRTPSSACALRSKTSCAIQDAASTRRPSASSPPARGCAPRKT
jgi:transposase